MAYKKATYSGPGALARGLHEFITTLGNGEAWSLVWGSAPTTANTQVKQCVYENKGSVGTDKIYVGVEFNFNEGLQQYYIMLRGIQGVNLSAGDLRGHYNVSEGAVISLGGSSFQFETRLFANSRRFMLHTLFGSYSQMLYGGLAVPIARPTEYPYPLVVFGNMTEDRTLGQKSTSSRITYVETRFIYNCDGWLAGYTNFQIFLPDNTWQGGYSISGASYRSDPPIGVYPWTVGAGGYTNKTISGTNSKSAFEPASTTSGMMEVYYENFADSNMGPLLEQNYIRRRVNKYTDQVLGSLEGIRGIIGSKVAGSEITDENGVKHYVIASANDPSKVSALEMQ